MTQVIVRKKYSKVTVKNNRVNVTVVKTPTRVVTIAKQGPPGAGVASYTHNQSSASTTWTINHNLGYKPCVTLFTVGGMEFTGQITHISNNQVQVNLAYPLAGTARLI